jgi:predicted lipid carrier protein YhbT
MIDGDTDLGLGIKNLLDSLDPDGLPPRLWQLICALGEAVEVPPTQAKAEVVA